MTTFAVGLIIFLTTQATPPVVHLFYTPDCGHCMDIILEHIPVLETRYHFTLKKYDINIIENYTLLEQMEENVDSIGEDLPAVFVGDSVFYGEDETRTKLGPTLMSLGAGTQPPDTIRVPPPDTHSVQSDSAGPDSVSNDTAYVHLYYFFQPGCRECDRIEILLSHLMQRRVNLKIYKYSILEHAHKLFLEQLSRQNDIPEEERLLVPIFIIGSDYLLKDEITLSKCEGVLDKYRSGSPEFTYQDTGSAEQSIIERFARFSIFGIIIAGLLDGVNPCAFATLIFFVSYLLFVGKRRREIAYMSVFFILAVFITYLAIGLGAYNLMKFIVGFNVFAKILFFCFGLIAFILGILSLRDFMLARRGETSKMLLQLPLGIKQRIHKNIKEKTAMGGIIIGSLIAGFMISLLEFGCTGQVYLPTITFMVTKTGFAVKPMVALILYNLMFILPLIIIALFATLVSKDRIAKALEKRIAVIKFFTALLFFGLALLLILSIW